MTKNARMILEIISNSEEHLTAEQIFLSLNEKNEQAVLATVYNNLSFLHGHGLIRKVSVEGYPDRYDRTVRHDHLVCRQCGKLSDVTLEDLTETIQKQIGVPLISYDLKISYLCPECLEKAKSNGGSER